MNIREQYLAYSKLYKFCLLLVLGAWHCAGHSHVSSHLCLPCPILHFGHSELF